MRYTENFTFATPEDYTYDSDLIEITGGNAQLKLKDTVGQDFTQDYANDTGFTYDSDIIEFTAGKVQQKDFLPADATCWITYTSDIDINYGGGTLTGSAVGGAAVSGNKLDLTHSDLRYVDYSATDNADPRQTGTLKCKVTPNYSGTPASSQIFVLICETDNSPVNSVALFHNGITGDLSLNVRDSTGTSITTCSVAWNPTAGNTYEITGCFDITAGATRLFVDGNIQASDLVGTGTRTASGLLRVGTNSSKLFLSNFSIEDIVIYDTVRYTSNYTPGYTLGEYRYAAAKVDLPDFDYTGPGNVKEFTNFVTVDSNARYIMDGNYHDGASWTSSDGSFTQANTEAEVLAEIATLPADDTFSISVVFDNSNSAQGEADNLVLTYTSQAYSTANPTVTINDTTRMEGLEGFTETATIAGSDAVKYTLSKGSIQYYYNSGWVVSDGTYAQANTAAEIETNKATFTTENVTVTIRMFLHSDDGTTTPTVQNIAVSYAYHNGMFISATEVTILTNISLSAGSIVRGGYIEAAENRIFQITNNYFQTGIDFQGDLTFNATARTVTAVSQSWTDEGFLADDICYIYGSYRNDKHVKVLSVSTSILTCVTGTTVVDELSGASILVSVVRFPTELKYTLAQMIKYDAEDRIAVSQNVKSRSLGPWSETFKEGSSGSGANFGYPDDIIGQLTPYIVIGAY